MSEVLRELEGIAEEVASERDWHAQCREAAAHTAEVLEKRGFDARVVAGGLKGLAPDEWDHAQPPTQGRHDWAEVVVDGQLYVVEPNSSSSDRAGEPAVFRGRPGDYIVYPTPTKQGVANA